MGKGEGKGECNCGDKEPYKSECGKKAGGYATMVAIAEGVGTIINMYPACCMCCTLGDGCWCLGILAGGLLNSIGGCIACCCKHNSCGFTWLLSTSVISLVLRCIMVVSIIVTLASFNTELDDYKTCFPACVTAKTVGYLDDDFNSGLVSGLYNGDDTLDTAAYKTWCEIGCENKMTLKDHQWTELAIDYLTIALIISIIYLLVSMAGTAAGFLGRNAELAAEKEGSANVDVKVVVAQPVN